MEHDLAEIWAALRGLGVIAALISATGAFITWIISVRVNSFQSVQDVKANTATLKALEVRIQELLSAQVKASTERADLRGDVKNLVRLVEDYIVAVGKVEESMRTEQARLRVEVHEINRKGCAAYQLEHGGGNGGTK